MDIELNATKLGIKNEEQLDIFSETIGETQGNKNLILDHLKSRVCVVESAGFVDQTIKIDGDNLGVADYIDYQIPILNNTNDRGFGFLNPDSFYYTEEHNDIFTRGQRWDNLTREAAGLEGDSFNGLMYDGPLPADIKYIYPRTQVTEGKNQLDFLISNDFWDGFIDRFEVEDEYGSQSNRTKPKNIEFTLQQLVDEEWEDVKNSKNEIVSLTASQESRSGKTAYAKVSVPSDPGVISGATYRLVIINEEVEYYKEGKRHTFSNSSMRVPFSWKSVVFASEITSVKNVSRGDIYENNISLVENPTLQKSIAFPKEGVSKLGSYSYRKDHPYLGLRVPYTRRYMYRLDHSLNAIYRDKISQGGISRVEITNSGSDYRLAPDITIASPEEGTTATAKAYIESGKLKFIKVTNSGSGYSDLSKLNVNKFISSNWGRGAVVRKEWMIQAAKFTHNFTLNGTKVVTHDGIKNIVFGSLVSGTGIPLGTRVTKVNSSTEFEISDSATASGTQTLAIDRAERPMPYISLEDQFGVETADVTLKTIDPAKLPKSDPRYDNPCQESFGIDFDESEIIADYTDSYEGQDLAEDAISAVTNYVALIEGATEDPNWLEKSVDDKASLIGDLNAGENSSDVESKEISAYGQTTEDEYVDDIKGTEHPSVQGLYIAKEADEIEQTGTTVNDDGTCLREVFPSVSSGAAKAIVNNQSLAEYRVVENAVANTATPWLSSFSREENPSLPKGFGINPGSPLTSEVFNNYARAVNNMSLVGAYVPVFARVRKFRQYEYRYIDDMGGITFNVENPKEAGEEESGGGVLGYGTWEAESKINYIDFIDPNDRQYKTAWFSADFGNTIKYSDDVTKNITGQVYDTGIELYRDIDETDVAYNRRLKKRNLKIEDSSYKPDDIGLPTIVNIPKELGVFCNPKMKLKRNENVGKDVGIELPSLNNIRASVFGGELVHTSETYDITDEDGRIVSSIVNIAGSDIIDTSYENEIIFGCQTRGKPFWSTFLKTTKEWTEFEIVPSPSFVDSLSSDEGMGTLNQIKGSVSRVTTLCENKEFSKVDTSLGQTHSLCVDGRNGMGVSAEFSYEDLFNLRDGDAVIGPVADSHEIVFDQTFGGQGTQIFKMEPEFTQALAVYGSHGVASFSRLGGQNASAGDTLHGYVGPCIHKCSPRAEAVFNASDEQLVFDLMAGSKKRALSSTSRMPKLVVFTDPQTGEKSYRYE